LNSEFGAYKGYIVRCTKNGLEYLNRNGEEEWIYTVSLNLPYFKSAGEYLWLQGSNQKTFMYCRQGEKVGKKAGLQYNKCKYKQRGLCYRPSQSREG